MTHDDYAARIYDAGLASDWPLLLLVGLTLRGRNGLAWVEYAFSLCQTLPALRAPAWGVVGIRAPLMHPRWSGP